MRFIIQNILREPATPFFWWGLPAQAPCTMGVAFFAAVLSTFVSTLPGADYDSVEKKQVLIVYGQQPDFLGPESWVPGNGGQTLQGGRSSVRYEVLCLDVDRARESSAADPRIEPLQLKRKDNPPDIVIPMDDSAAEWTIEVQPDLFPDAVILPGFLSSNLIARFRSPPELAEWTSELDFGTMVDTVLRLFPDTRKVIVASRVDEAELERITSADARLKEATNSGELTHLFWIGSSPSMLSENVAKLEEGTILLYLTTLRAQDGDSSSNLVSEWNQICEKAAVPIVGLDMEQGVGVLGGNLGGELGLDQLTKPVGGAAVTAMDPAEAARQGPSIIGMKQTGTDWGTLFRSGIRDIDLPPGSVITVRMPGFWEKNWVWIASGGMAILLQAFTIVGLLIGRRRRIKLEKSLEVSRDEAKRLTGRVLANQEEDARTLARELHDDFCQRLAASAIGIGGIEQPMDPGDPSRNALAGIRETLVQLSKDMHRVSRQLHPSILEEVGVVDAVRSECIFWETQSQVKFMMVGDRLPNNLPADAALCLFRVAQEAIRNLVKHANATEAEICWKVDSGSIQLRIADNGDGFTESNQKMQPGLGLASMRERVSFVGGDLEVESEAGAGTTLIVTIPGSCS